MAWKSVLLIGVILAACLAWITGASAIARTLSDIADTPWVVAVYLGSLAVLVVALYLLYRTRFKPKRRTRSRPVARTKRPVDQVLADIDRRLTDPSGMDRLDEDSTKPSGIVLFGAAGAGTSTLVRRLAQTLEPDLVSEVGALQTDPERNQRTLALARRAGVPVLVVENDLRAHEFAAIETLAGHSPKPVVVLNKADRFGAAQRARLLDILVERLDGIVPAERIVTVSADPRPIRREGPDPENPGRRLEQEIAQSPDISELLTLLAPHLPTAPANKTR